MLMTDLIRLGATSLLLGSLLACQKGDDKIPDVPDTPDNPENPVTPDPDEGAFYRGTSLYFASWLERTGGVTYREDGVATSPFKSVKQHGGNMIRLMVEPEAYENKYASAGDPIIDYLTFERVREDMRKAHDAGLEVFLTLKPEKSVPRCWQGVKSDRKVLGDSLYNWSFRVLDALGKEGLLPALISIGNETNQYFMTDGYDAEAEANSTYDKERNIYFINRAAEAVSAIEKKYSREIPVSIHIFGPDHVEWFMSENASLKPQIDFLSLSYYPGWHTMNSWRNFGDLADWLQKQYKLKLFLLETAVPWSTVAWNDDRVNTYQNVWYGGTASPAGQAAGLKKMALELQKAGVMGMIYWGGDWVGSKQTFVYPDAYGKGSSWENCTFWDLEYNIHEGIEWMNF